MAGGVRSPADASSGTPRGDAPSACAKVAPSATAAASPARKRWVDRNRPDRCMMILRGIWTPSTITDTSSVDRDRRPRVAARAARGLIPRAGLGRPATAARGDGDHVMQSAAPPTKSNRIHDRGCVTRAPVRQETIVCFNRHVSTRAALGPASRPRATTGKAGAGGGRRAPLAGRNGTSRTPRLRGAPGPGVWRLSGDLHAHHDGRQRRARDQLLGRVPEVPLGGAGRLRGGVALAALSAVLGRGRRAERSLRFAAHHPDRRRAVHERVDRLGLLLPHRQLADVARDGAAGAARLRRRAVEHVEPDAALRHRRPREAAERGAPQRDGALPRRLRRPGRRQPDHADARPDARHLSQRRLLPAAAGLAGARAVRPALSRRRRRREARRARPGRHRADDPRYPGRAGDRRDGAAGRGGVVLRRQQLPGADAGVRARSGPRRSRHRLHDAAGRRRRGRAARRVLAREPRADCCASSPARRCGWR